MQPFFSSFLAQALDPTQAPTPVAAGAGVIFTGAGAELSGWAGFFALVESLTMHEKSFLMSDLSRDTGFGPGLALGHGNWIPVMGPNQWGFGLGEKIPWSTLRRV
jgi:hypothetical protein